MISKPGAMLSVLYPHVDHLPSIALKEIHCEGSGSCASAKTSKEIAGAAADAFPSKIKACNFMFFFFFFFFHHNRST